MPELPPAPWGKPWFHPKTFGYGAGLPCSWEGWLVMVGYFAALTAWIALVLRLAPPPDSAGVAILLGGSLPLTLALVLIAWGRTAGGWRGRWKG